MFTFIRNKYLLDSYSLFEYEGPPSSQKTICPHASELVAWWWVAVGGVEGGAYLLSYALPGSSALTRSLGDDLGLLVLPSVWATLLSSAVGQVFSLPPGTQRHRCRAKSWVQSRGQASTRAGRMSTTHAWGATDDGYQVSSGERKRKRKKPSLPKDVHRQRRRESR